METHNDRNIGIEREEFVNNNNNNNKNLHKSTYSRVYVHIQMNVSNKRGGTA